MAGSCEKRSPGLLVSGVGSRGCWVQRDLSAEVFPAPDQVVLERRAGTLVQEIGAQVVGAALALQEGVEDHQEGVGNGDEGFVGTAAVGRPPILSPKMGGGVRRSMGGFP